MTAPNHMLQSYLLASLFTSDYRLLAAQTVEAIELTFAEIEPILKTCCRMSDYDKIIETKIAKRYSVGKELKMRDLPLTDPERIEYEVFKESIKAPIRSQKKEMGLIQ